MPVSLPVPPALPAFPDAPPSVARQIQSLPGYKDQVALYVRRIADQLALRDWTFEFLSEYAEAGYNVQIAPIPGRRYALVKLGRSFASLSTEAKRHALCHELFHCLLAPAQTLGDTILPKTARKAFDLNMEMGIDALADAISQFLPLPDF